VTEQLLAEDARCDDTTDLDNEHWLASLREAKLSGTPLFR
jgi:hypothetical protein